MKKMMDGMIFLLAAVITAGCTANEIEQKQDPPNERLSPTDVEPGEDITEIQMSDFFLPNSSKAHYKGEGNEFAELDIEVTVIDETYTVVEENNGGVLIRKIYRVDEDRIDMISENPIDLDEKMPTVTEIDVMQPLEIYLQKPFEKGTTFGDWEIVQTGANVETAYKIFQDAIVVQMTDQTFINRRYFVRGFGEVKRESIMITSEGEDFIVTSTLETVE